jgi:uncharacterized phage protein (TIGR02218 family)
MRSVAAALANHIQVGKTVYAADLYTLTLISDMVLRWSGGDASVTTGGDTYAPGPIITRGRMSWKMGLNVDELLITAKPRPGQDSVNGVTLYQAARRGDFSGAAVKLARAFCATPGGSILDVVTRFTGRINQIEMDAGGVRFTVQSLMYLLDKPFPANTWKPECGNVLYDGMCKANPTSFRSTGVITSVTSQSWIQTGLSGLAVDAYRLGRFRFTSGANAGMQRTVKANTSGGTFYFAAPWPAPIANGDAFEVFLGCDNRKTTCNAKFSNLINFRGAPFIPLPETTT